MKIRLRQAYKEIQEGHQVYVLQPGRNKVFFRDFLNQSRVFLELPFVTLRSPFELDDQTRSELFMGHAWADWFRDPDSWMGRPSRKASDYHPKTGWETEGGKVDGRIIYAAKRLFADAQVGDLVLVPGAHFDGPVLAGEFTFPFSSKTTAKATFYKGQAVPARRVRWLAVDGIKHDFSSGFIKKLVNRRPIIELSRRFRREAYDYAYGDYVLGDLGSNIVIDVEPAGAGDSSVDPLAQRKAQDLILYFNALFNAIQDKSAGSFRGLSINEAIASDYYSLEPLAAEYEIHSPGSIIYRVRSAAKMGFIGAMLALTSPSLPVSADEIDDIEIVNKWNKVPSTCDIQVREMARSALKHVHFKRWQELCELKRASEQNIRTVTSTSVNPAEDESDDE